VSSCEFVCICLYVRNRSVFKELLIFMTCFSMLDDIFFTF